MSWQRRWPRGTKGRRGIAENYLLVLLIYGPPRSPQAWANRALSSEFLETGSTQSSAIVKCLFFLPFRNTHPSHRSFLCRTEVFFLHSSLHSSLHSLPSVPPAHLPSPLQRLRARTDQNPQCPLSHLRPLELPSRMPGLPKHQGRSLCLLNLSS